MKGMMTQSAIKGMTSNQLIQQYENYESMRWSLYDSINDGSGNIEAHECDTRKLADIEATLKMLKTEIIYRRSRGFLYDGRRNMIKSIWDWAKTKTEDERHRYNMVRKAMMKRGILMLSYENTYILN